MRCVLIWLLLAVAAAELPTHGVEEEDVDEYYDDYDTARNGAGINAMGSTEQDETDHERMRRDVHDSGPYVEHKRIKRSKRSPEYSRTKRSWHQYEVHESTDDGEMDSPPYEEMLAASANHYHKVYVPAPRSLNFEVPSANVANADTFSTPNVKPLAEQKFVAEQISPVPVQFVGSPGVNPNPLLDTPVVPSEPLIQAPKQLAEDQFSASTGHHKQHSHGHAQGGGHNGHGGHHGEHGGKTSKGFHHNHYVDKGGKGHKTDEHHRKEYEEAAGKKKKHHDNAGHKGSHEEEAFGHRGAKFDEKKGHKKGHKTKGYHNKYHKDEFHKEHKFYDDYHKSGEHHRFGKFNAKHASNESGKKKAHHVNAGHDYVERGKKGYTNKGHLDSDHKGYHGKQGHEEHHENHKEHGRKGGKEGGSQWGYKKN